MKGHFLVSRYILERCAQARVFVTSGPVFGVNEESVLAVSLQDFPRGRGKSLFEIRCFGYLRLFPSIDCGPLRTRTKFLMKLNRIFRQPPHPIRAKSQRHILLFRREKIFNLQNTDETPTQSLKWNVAHNSHSRSHSGAVQRRFCISFYFSLM